MLGIIVRGRGAWIASSALGAILLIVGAIIANARPFALIAGAGFLLFGLVFLILSFVTHGATD